MIARPRHHRLKIRSTYMYIHCVKCKCEMLYDENPTHAIGENIVLNSVNYKFACALSHTMYIISA